LRRQKKSPLESGLAARTGGGTACALTACLRARFSPRVHIRALIDRKQLQHVLQPSPFRREIFPFFPIYHPPSSLCVCLTQRGAESMFCRRRRFSWTAWC